MNECYDESPLTIDLCESDYFIKGEGFDDKRELSVFGYIYDHKDVDLMIQYKDNY